MTGQTSRPEDPADRWIGGRTDPGQITVRTRFLYSEHHPQAILPAGVTRHAFFRGGDVTSTDWEAPAGDENSIRHNISRAIASFGDDADIVITVARAGTPSAPTTGQIHTVGQLDELPAATLLVDAEGTTWVTLAPETRDMAILDRLLTSRREYLTAKRFIKAHLYPFTVLYQPSEG